MALDPKNPRADYYLGLAQLQSGDREGALKRWKALLEDTPADAPWHAGLEQAIAQASAPSAPGPDADAVAAAQDMTPQARQQMIEGMVGRLADQLAQKPDDLDGWLRLIRAYQVLGQKDKAVAALASARSHFRNDKTALMRLDEAQNALN